MPPKTVLIVPRMLKAIRTQAYSTGMNLSSGSAAAIPFFRRAVEIDPKFAIAYAALGLDYSDIGESVLSAESTTKGWQLRDRVNDREKFFIDFTYDRQVQYRAALAVSQAVFATSPPLLPFTQGSRGATRTAAEIGLDRACHEPSYGCGHRVEAAGYEKPRPSRRDMPSPNWPVIFLDKPSVAAQFWRRAFLPQQPGS